MEYHLKYHGFLHSLAGMGCSQLICIGQLVCAIRLVKILRSVRSSELQRASVISRLLMLLLYAVSLPVNRTIKKDKQINGGRLRFAGGSVAEFTAPFVETPLANDSHTRDLRTPNFEIRQTLIADG